MNTFISHCKYIRLGICPDCTGKVGGTPLIKVICTLRILSYGIPVGMVDDMFNMFETTPSSCLGVFPKTKISRLKAKYLRDPSSDDIANIERKFAATGFPGCIGSVDCAAWRWKACKVVL